MAKLSGIGCSSKTPAYFLREAHGFNGVHGRMPALVTGANAANRDIIYIGVSGDGDSLSIGLGQLCHAIRRNVNVLYVLENNGVYGLTKGQFSASADPGLAQQEGGSEHDGGDRRLPAGADARRDVRGAQLLGRQGAARADHQGRAVAPGLRVHRRDLALRHLQRPRGLDQELRLHAREERRGGAGRLRAADRARSPPTTSPAPSSTVMLHDGSWVRLRKVAEDYDPTDRDRAYAYIRERQKEGEVVTGLLYLSPDSSDVHEQNNTVADAADRSCRTRSCARAARSWRSCRRASGSESWRGRQLPVLQSMHRRSGGKAIQESLALSERSRDSLTSGVESPVTLFGSERRREFHVERLGAGGLGDE